jgi:hypothetical protein
MIPAGCSKNHSKSVHGAKRVGPLGCHPLIGLSLITVNDLKSSLSVPSNGQIINRRGEGEDVFDLLNIWPIWVSSFFNGILPLNAYGMPMKLDLSFSLLTIMNIGFMY